MWGSNFIINSELFILLFYQNIIWPLRLTISCYSHCNTTRFQLTTWCKHTHTHPLFISLSFTWLPPNSNQSQSNIVNYSFIISFACMLIAALVTCIWFLFCGIISSEIVIHPWRPLYWSLTRVSVKTLQRKFILLKFYKVV